MGRGNMMCWVSEPSSAVGKWQEKWPKGLVLGPVPETSPDGNAGDTQCVRAA
jgi:hypothetical protein